MEIRNSEITTEVLSQRNESREIAIEVQPSLARDSELGTEIGVPRYDSSETYIEISVPINDHSKIETEISSIYRGNSETLTEITAKPNNSFKAKFKLIAVGNSDKEVEITSRPLRENDSFAEIYSRALGVETKETYLNVMYRGNSDVFTEIQPIGYNNMLTEIEVPPHNRMWAIYEVQQPPIVTDIFNPTQDAFTREQSAYESINYGQGSSMVVGRSKDDIWRSFVQFDTASIDKAYVLTESYLRLYYKGSVPSDIKLEILNADSAWQETNITNLNKPNPIDLITSDFSVNVQEGYIEFDVIDIVKSWVALEKINNGFIVRISNETTFGQATFNTRESHMPPELVVKYYDSRIFSQGRSQQLTEIFAYLRRHSNKNTEITVSSVFAFSRQDTEIYVHRIEVPLDSDILTEITANKLYVPVQIIASIRDKSEVPIEIGIRTPEESRIDAEITISRPAVLTTINSARRDKLEIDTLISVTKPSVKIEISVPAYKYSQILAEVEVPETWTSLAYTEIHVSKDTAKVEITPRVARENSLQTAIYISRPKVETEIEVRYRNDIWVEIEPNIKSDVKTEISATKPYIEVEISVYGYDKSEVDVEIFVAYTDNVLTEIDAKAVSQVETVIDIKVVSQISTEISASRRKVNTVITVPTWADYDVVTAIEPRILMVDNIYTIIQVGSKGGAYAFII